MILCPVNVDTFRCNHIHLLQGQDATKFVKRKTVKVRRPLVWEDVKLKPIPFQDGEDAEDEEISTTTTENAAIPDPLGLKELDLIERQEAFAAGRISVKSNRQRGAVEKKTDLSPSKKSSFLNHVHDSDSDEEGDGFEELSDQSSDDEPSSPSLKDKSPQTTPNSKAATRRQTTSPLPRK